MMLDFVDIACLLLVAVDLCALQEGTQLCPALGLPPIWDLQELEITPGGGLLGHCLDGRPQREGRCRPCPT